MVKRLLENYRNISLEILEELDKEGFSELENLQKQKSEIQNEIKELNLSQTQIKEALIEFEIIEIDQKIINKLMIKKIETKEKMDNIKKRKATNNAYANAGNKVQYLNSRI